MGGGAVNWAGRRVGVAGLGVSGRAVVAALAPLGAELTLIDDAAPGALAPGEVDLGRLELLVVSPGWPPHGPLLAGARAAGLPIWSEVELAWRLRANPDAPWLVVTGTNGKTTTVEMLGAMLTAGGARAATAGNVGTPLVSAVLAPQTEVFAVELSSFQLHHTRSVRPLAAAVLNVAPDHLDWHGSFEAYAAAKARIFAGVRSAAIFPADDPAVAALAADAVSAGGGSAGGGSPGAGQPGGGPGTAVAADAAGSPRAVGFALRAPRLGELGLIDGQLADRAFTDRRRRHAETLASLDDLAHLAGPGGRLAPHLVADALAAAALALAYGTPPDGIGPALRGFGLGPHRLAEVGRAGGVRFVDDSKATNAHAAAAALASFAPGGVVWIAGGLAKGARFESLVAACGDRLKAAVLIGLDQSQLRAALAAGAPEVPVVAVAPGPDVMGRAVAAAAGLAAPGDTVLLAPASASMDQFETYADRGRQFAAAVAKLVSADAG
ncbi:MAG: UDP-N-acetylmuramoyl-L-alanine--D-glutamate ligase [Bifidobacteriaceae bacterium]|jgi:UDP-N-acetylmuramoylalanine--D-glutamate ligase|nr:UDP-N-acetylmuramoyl-L-alanine--D-glutamate ligase [Bifidobacteriaceae bacterium]